MGSVGDAYDNATCESFFATLECELLARSRFKTPAKARSAVFGYLEGFYNPRGASPRSLSLPDRLRASASGSGHRCRRTPAPAVLAAVKDPCGRPQAAAILDRRCARPPQQRATGTEEWLRRGPNRRMSSTKGASMLSNHRP
jgi:hypothetical protein